MSETTLQLPQGPVRVREEGEGPPIVFIHGLLVDGRLWDDVVAPLSKSARCIVPDLPLGSHRTALKPGADLTPYGLAKLIADLLAALELHDVTLVANDTGGGLSQILVTRHPDRVGRLVLTPCDAFENFPPRMFRPLQYIAGYVPGAAALIGQSMRSKAMATSALGFGPLAFNHRPDLYLSWLEPLRKDRGVRRDLRKVLRGIRPRYTLEAAELLPGFHKPALIAWADKDRFFPREHAERLSQLLPDARLETIEGSRTFISFDQPERLATLIADFAGVRSSEEAGAEALPPR
jgi:pimeloyl-ACP methyl ester carboxylesterase